KEVDGVVYSFPGDWATVDTDGSLQLLGRGSQCINTGGEKVFPEEVEEVIKRHGAVADCLIFGIPDERFGQRIVGVYSLRDGGTWCWSVHATVRSSAPASRSNCAPIDGWCAYVAMRPPTRVRPRTAIHTVAKTRRPTPRPLSILPTSCRRAAATTGRVAPSS